MLRFGRSPSAIQPNARIRRRIHPGRMPRGAGVRASPAPAPAPLRVKNGLAKVEVHRAYVLGVCIKAKWPS